LKNYDKTIKASGEKKVLLLSFALHLLIFEYRITSSPGIKNPWLFI